MLSLKRYNPILCFGAILIGTKKSRMFPPLSLDSTVLFCYNQIHLNISMFKRRSDGSVCFFATAFEAVRQIFHDCQSDSFRRIAMVSILITY